MIKWFVILLLGIPRVIYSTIKLKIMKMKYFFLAMTAVGMMACADKKEAPQNEPVKEEPPADEPRGFFARFKKSKR